MHRLSIVVALSLFATPALSQEPEPAAAEASDDGMGLSAELGLAYASPDAIYNPDGEKNDLAEGVEDSNVLINVKLKKEFGFGLHLGLDIPIVSHSQKVIEERSKTGVGDVSLYAGYMLNLLDIVKAGARARLKVGSGTSPEDAADDDTASTGSGNAHAQLSVLGAIDLLGIALDAELGYLLTFTRLTGVDTKVNNGDAVFADIKVGYAVTDMIKPALRVLFLNQGETELIEEANAITGQQASTETVKDSGAQWLALALDVDIRVNDMLTVYAGWGTPLDAYGVNLHYGYVLMGKNTPAGLAAFNAGVKASF